MNVSRIGIYSAVILAVATVAAEYSFAEISPEYYEKMQRGAPEALSIEVLSVTVTRMKYSESTVCDVCSTARIVSVERSEKGYRPGRVIVIRYSTVEHSKPIVGMAEVPILKAGKTIPAFLETTPNGCSLEPAARSHSFSPCNGTSQSIEKHRPKST